MNYSIDLYVKVDIKSEETFLIVSLYDKRSSHIVYTRRPLKCEIGGC